MKEQSRPRESLLTSENSWIVIPFYTDPQSPHYDATIDRFAEFLERSKEVTGLNLAVIDDGSGLSYGNLTNTPDVLISLPVNKGKASAMRDGLHTLLEDVSKKTDFIVQYDGDGDQSYADIPIVHQKLVEISQSNPNIPVLVIGDRYSEDLIVPPNPDSVAYRQTLLMFFGAIAKNLGFDNVRDWVSGARGYTRAYARAFLENSKSSRYGLEAEQLVVASLVGAKVTTAPLTESRPRDPHTLTSKWLQNFEVYLDHEEALRKQGKGHIVDLAKRLVVQLREEHDVFDLDLSPIGEDTRMRFTRLGDRYTAEIPHEHRARLFAEDTFPFSIKRNPSLRA
ncbi:hypothetical protein HY405_00265 [Candidatus Microgenomates bacterium]|nr:hypothetical protein [Candidatus Microgenomates bacterium]